LTTKLTDTKNIYECKQNTDKLMSARKNKIIDKIPKQRTCLLKSCSKKFTPLRSTDKVCSKLCDIKYSAEKRKPIKKKPVKIAAVSKKRSEQNKEYTKTRLQFLSENFLCQRCFKSADEIHHKAGRTGERLNDVKDFMVVCRTCHQYIHEHPAESREKGWLL